MQFLISNTGLTPREKLIAYLLLLDDDDEELLILLLSVIRLRRNFFWSKSWYNSSIELFDDHQFRRKYRMSRSRFTYILELYFIISDSNDDTIENKNKAC
jgi:hypothetical protein